MKYLLLLLIVPVAACQRSDKTDAATSTASTGPAACRASDLRMTLEGSDAGAGQRGMTFALTNSSSKACLTGGYPSLRLVDSLGHPLDSIRVTEMAATYGPIASSTPFSLAPDSAAYFQITFTGIPAGITCFQARQLGLVPPGANDTLTMDTTIAPCGDHLNLAPIRQGRPPM